jgi:ribosomal protein L14E/L6E/L27E
MTKKFSIHGTTMTVSKQNAKDAYYRVELTDANGFQTVVYEKSFNDAVLYANKWEAKTAKRKKHHDLETKAMEEIIERDRRNGTMLSLD